MKPHSPFVREPNWVAPGFDDPRLFSKTPVEIAPGVDIPGMMIRQSTEGEIRGYEKRRRLPAKDMAGWSLGQMQAYRNYIGFWAPDVLFHMRSHVWADDDGASLEDF